MPTPKKKHALHKLVGKTITKIDVTLFDQYGNDESVGEVLRVKCSDGSNFEFFVDGGDGRYYGTVVDLDLSSFDEDGCERDGDS